MNDANSDHKRSTSSNSKEQFLPFVYTAMDAACLAETQMIYAVRREGERYAFPKEPNFGIYILSPVGGFEK